MAIQILHWDSDDVVVPAGSFSSNAYPVQVKFVPVIVDVQPIAGFSQTQMMSSSWSSPTAELAGPRICVLMLVVSLAQPSCWYRFPG